MTLSLADEALEKTSGSSRPTRACYVPPHLRNKSFSTPVSSQIPSSNETLPGSQLNRSGSRESRRSGRCRWGDRQRGGGHETNPFDVADKFADLEVSQDETGGGGINFDAYEDIPVETSGSDVPPPVNTFAEIDLGDALSENIRRCKYVKPTPVQRHAIPIAVAGRDLMACAQTGSGKTAAFCFPIISGIMRNWMQQPMPPHGARTACPLALVLSPTRELSCQIHEEAKKFSYQTGVRVVVAYGGAPVFQQLRDLEKGVDILVATPGRLVDLIERTKVSLRMIKYLALDEADRMLDMGFEPQIRRIVEQMDMPPPGVRQTMLFSATFPNEIQRLAFDFLSNYIFLAVGRVGSSTDLISQRVEFVQEKDKRSYLLDLLHAQSQTLTLVFVETKKGADSLEHWLSTNGFLATAIHGDKVQVEREKALRSFKSGHTPILVATDVAARGLDIPHVSHVINFDLPKDIDDYVHRIGRTGRAGKSGLATAFFNEGNRSIAKALSELMQEAHQEVPAWLSQYAERHSERSSFYGGGGRSCKYGSGRFGGHDYRRDAPPRGGNCYYYSYRSGPGGAGDAPPRGGKCYYNSYSFGPGDAGDGPYSTTSHVYGFNHEPVVASGWD
ncbi:PREDICTED: DEAD-box ATP-dependent RNA helicase 52C-like isoform X2 [Nelumbo nucifera]|uniref:RNA helicase n=1 Tax=Nelumbo nucifera TaxID=4432 RepID=A0A1U7Z9C5_NELNU|nr:PREDICTED: DEAD-box ATP-dependent RNA helicase 52C-like isoform X2 [Nelumbo nucifera]